ncbi:hypothetical protein SKDZ_14G3260 [Saccharomyces kudriavzevii ZP591]|uniref:Autophagy-related protein 3 n=1 Tax=Saccharomyces cerevisiae x Saccharomyces kudriavzevii (strain VIN7) TaxID=1095631 RepID=H0H0G8_SACCK|nr:Atg3p [Saccharomyces cerevisiae x Saccharomyces kudriavzevii VIN7]CAI4050367.1 hypothetical protein SKDZ_14G3260 [Saccharomyces kudriavzevii ZP591]
MIRSTLSSWREYLTPITHKSTFLTTGQITPEEFVQAGDYLCHMFPTWKWNEGSSDVSYRDFLPKNKQFLVIRKVPCDKRAEQCVEVEGADVDVKDFAEDGDEGDVLEYIGSETEHIQSTSEGGTKDLPIDDIDELIQDMEIKDDYENEDAEKRNGASTLFKDIAQERYYDLYIAYSTSYRVPKMYIVGFNADGSPLTPEQMFEDISPDYRTKTATIEKLPFYKNSILSVSIHPCKHANVMKILLDKVRVVRQRRRKEQQEEQEIDGAGDWEDLQDDIDDSLRVDQYLIVFLKFITSVTPSIQHDYTMEGW